MPDDGLRSLLGTLEDDVPEARPAFATSLHDALATELRLAARMPARTHRAAWLTLVWPRTMRSAWVLAGLLLLAMAAVALAGAMLRAWLTDAPTGIQYSGEFALVELARDPEGAIFDLQLDRDGETLLGLRDWFERLSMTSSEAGVVRYEASAEGGMEPRLVLPLAAARDPSLWAAGTPLEDGVVHQSIGGTARHAFSVAADGSIFLSLALYPTDGPPGPLATTVVVATADGTLRCVLTDADLVDGDRFEGLDQVLSIMVVASSPDLLWGRVEGPLPDGSRYWWFQALDPTADGDWSDRVIQPLTLPDTVPHRPAGDYTVGYGALEAEPSVGGIDRTRSVLWPAMTLAGRYSVHRLTDADLDGDLTDEGEVELVASALGGSDASPMFMPPVSPRVVLDGARVVVDELVAGGLTRASRVSRLTADGPVDIVRALPMTVDGVVADRRGGIFVVYQAWSEDGTRFQLIDRLEPQRVPAAGAAPSPRHPSAPALQALVPTAPVGSVGPWIAVQLQGGGQEELLLVGPDGSGPARAVDGEHVSNGFLTADGRHIVVRAATEAPGESWTLVTDRDGSASRVVSERYEPLDRASPADAVLLAAGREDHRSVIRHDLATGTEALLAEDVALLAPSPDRSRLAIADGPARTTLAVLDSRTGARSVVADAGSSTVRAAWWSPDGRTLAWLSGGPAGPDPTTPEDFVLHTMGLDGVAGPLALPIIGQLPMVSWSAEGSWLAVLTAGSQVWLAGVTHGSAWPIDVQAPSWVGWSPTDPEVLAVADADGIRLVAPGGRERPLASRVTAAPCPACDGASIWEESRWLGWSPDGRWIGLGRDSGAVVLVDAITGALSVPFASTEDAWIGDQSWWP